MSLKLDHFENGTTFLNTFENIVDFLMKWKWLYQHRNVQLLVSNALSNIPESWTNSCSLLADYCLNQNTDISSAEVPNDFYQFIADCQQFTIDADFVEAESDPVKTFVMPGSLKKGLTPKKMHEVETFVRVINTECSEQGVSNILDIGSGLGYIDRTVITFNSNYKILGLESNSNLVTEAQRLAMQVCPTVSDRLAYETLKVTDDQIPEICTKCDEHFKATDSNDGSTCVIGLHPCGDLTVDCIRLFQSSERIKSLLLLPCCYHKMSLNSNFSEQTRFVNFPLSNALKEAMNQNQGSFETLNVPFLRLAAQETKNRWRQMSVIERHHRAFKTLSRAIVEFALVQENLNLKKTTRRQPNQLDENNWTNFTTNYLKRVQFLDCSEKEVAKEVILGVLNELWDRSKYHMDLVDLYNCLQTCIQSVCESLVILDKVAYLKEQGYTNYKLLKIMDDVISPRCIAIIVHKQLISQHC